MSEVEDELEEFSSLLKNCRMEAQFDHELAKRFRLLHGLSIILGGCLIVLILVWVFHYLGGLAWQSNPAVQFNWHPLLMIIAMIFLYAQSMLIYRAGRNARKRTLKLWHSCLHGTVFVLSVVALKAVFDSHNLAAPPVPNMYSLHSWIGLGTVLLFCCQLVAGFVSFLYPGLPMRIRTAYMYVHTTFGTLGFLLALITAVLGLYEKTFFRLKLSYSALSGEAILINFIGLSLVSFGALVMYLINDVRYKRVPLPEDDHLLLAATHTDSGPIGGAQD